MRRAIVLSALAALAACSETPRTQVMLVVDGDVTDADTLYVEARSPEGRLQVANAFLGAGEPPLPRVLGLSHESGRLGPYQVRVVAREGTRDLVTRNLRFDFQERRTLQLRVELVEACATTACDSGETCSESGCRPETIAPSELTEWTGAPSAALSAGDAGP